MTTPVWNMPQPGMLPNGMPLPREAEQSGGITIVREGPIPGVVVRSGRRPVLTVIRDEGASDERLRFLDGLFESAMAEYGVTSSLLHATAPRPEVSRETVVRRVELLRARLHLTAEETAAILGLGIRRFYELVRGAAFPEGRLAEIDRRASIMVGLAARDWQTAVELIRGRTEDTIQLLDGARYGELREVFERTWRDRREILDGMAIVDPLTQAATRVADVTAILAAPSFDLVAKVIHWVGRSDDLVAERARAAVELADTLRALDNEDQVGEAWDFLFGLDARERVAFRRRAEMFIRGDSFDAVRWHSFLAAEADRAWESATTVRLDPLDVSIDYEGYPEAEARPWQPDILSMGIDFRLHDRRRA